MPPKLPQTLTELAIKYKCDKYYRHSYMPFYESLFGSLLNVGKVLEIGIGYKALMEEYVPEYVHGASLRMWADYWPGAKIFGCDVNQSAVDELMDDPDRRVNIEAFGGDQSSPASLLYAVERTGGDWNVVIDDGSHQTEHQILSARVLLPHLAINGVYIVEDVQEPGKVARAIGGEWVFKGDRTPDDNLVMVRRWRA